MNNNKKEDFNIRLEFMDYNSLVSNKDYLTFLLEYVYDISFKHLDNTKNIAIESYDKMLKFEADKTAVIIGAFNKDELLGFTWAYERCFLRKTRMHINQIVVGPSFTRLGVGGKLLAEIEKIAIDRKIYNLDLMATVDNKAASDIYTSRGFEAESVLFKKTLEVK